MNWKVLDSEEALQNAFEESINGTVILFKHSTSCPVSAAALKRFEKEGAMLSENFPVYYLDLLAFRSISNQIAEKTGVTHQSPQLIVLKNGEVVHHASHLSISADKVAKYIQN